MRATGTIAAAGMNRTGPGCRIHRRGHIGEILPSRSARRPAARQAQSQGVLLNPVTGGIGIGPYCQFRAAAIRFLPMMRFRRRRTRTAQTCRGIARPARTIRSRTLISACRFRRRLPRLPRGRNRASSRPDLRPPRGRHRQRRNVRKDMYSILNRNGASPLVPRGKCSTPGRGSAFLFLPISRRGISQSWRRKRPGGSGPFWQARYYWRQGTAAAGRQ